MEDLNIPDVSSGKALAMQLGLTAPHSGSAIGWGQQGDALLEQTLNPRLLSLSSAQRGPSLSKASRIPWVCLSKQNSWMCSLMKEKAQDWENVEKWEL